MINGLKPVKPGYGSAFAVSENPISESAHWRNGFTNGLDRCDMRTINGIAHGTQNGNSGLYDDSVAILTGTWGANQYVEADVYSSNPNTTAFCEVELWVHAQISANRIYGIETNFRCTTSGSYIGVVRWNGPLGVVGNQASADAAFTQYGSNFTSFGGVSTGTHIAVQVIGSTHTVYVDGALLVTTDLSSLNGTVLQGNPGMGHWYHINGATGTAVTDHGLRNFRARNI